MNFFRSEPARSKCIELFDSPEGAARAFGIEDADDALDLGGFSGKRSARALAGHIVEIPTGSQESEKSLRIPERRFDGKVSQIVERAMCSVPRLFLPHDRTVVPRAAQDSGAIGSFCYLNAHRFVSFRRIQILPPFFQLRPDLRERAEFWAAAYVD